MGFTKCIIFFLLRLSSCSEEVSLPEFRSLAESCVSKGVDLYKLSKFTSRMPFQTPCPLLSEEADLYLQIRNTSAYLDDERMDLQAREEILSPLLAQINALSLLSSPEKCAICPSLARAAYALHILDIAWKVEILWDPTANGPLLVHPFSFDNREAAFHALESLQAGKKVLESALQRGEMVEEFPGWPVELDGPGRMSLARLFDYARDTPDYWNGYMEDDLSPNASIKTYSEKAHGKGVMDSKLLFEVLFPGKWFAIRGSLLAMLRYGAPQYQLRKADGTVLLDSVDEDMDVMLCLDVPEEWDVDRELSREELLKVTSLLWTDAVNTIMSAAVYSDLKFDVCIQTSTPCREERGCTSPLVSGVLVCLRDDEENGSTFRFALDITMCVRHKDRIYSDLIRNQHANASLALPTRGCPLFDMEIPCPQSPLAAVRSINHWTTHDTSCLALPDGEMRRSLDPFALKQILGRAAMLENIGFPTILEDFWSNCKEFHDWART